MKTINKESLPFTTIAILKGDLTIFDCTVCNENGEFTIDIPSGDYILKASLIGYSTVFKNVRLNKDIDLGIITLSVNVTYINEVVVSGKKPTVKMGSDRLIYNVTGTLIAKNNNTWDVLKHAPLVISMNDTPSIIGKSDTKIYINGKPSRLRDCLNFPINLFYRSST